MSLNSRQKLMVCQNFSNLRDFGKVANKLNYKDPPGFQNLEGLTSSILPKHLLRIIQQLHSTNFPMTWNHNQYFRKSGLYF